jgi:hypothetical protein
MDDQRHAAALTDEAAGDEIARDIARALAVDPSPEFVARVRTQIANEPAPGMWRRAVALRWPVAVAAVTLLLAVVILNRPRALIVGAPLVSRATPFDATTLPYVASGFSRTIGSPPKGGRHVRIDSTVGPPEGGPHVQVLLDPRETQALRSLLAGVRNSRVDLSSVLRPGAAATIELPPIDDLVIAPIAIDPIAPQGGAQGERQ